MEVFSFFHHIFASISCQLSFDLSQSDCCEVESQGYFDLNFPDENVPVRNNNGSCSKIKNLAIRTPIKLKSFVRQRTQSIGQNGNLHTGKTSVPTLYLIEG